VHVIGHQVPLLYPALFLRSQLAKYLSQVYAQLLVQGASSALGDKDHVVFAIPRRMTQTFKLVHRVSSFRVLGGSRLEVSTVDYLLKSQTSTASPAEPGGLPW